MEIARPVSGLCRGRWQWQGKLYTAAGVEVPQDVMLEDEALFEEDKEIAPDEQVLDMAVTLPKEALPEGYSLVPISPKKAAKKT